jgi:16S rRNA processing protein RimM
VNATAAPPVPAPQDAPPFPQDAVEVGRVLGAWGLKGGVKVKPFASDPQALFSSKRWFLKPPQTPRPQGPGAAAPLPALLRVQSAREQGDTVVATVQELADRDAADALKGARVFVSRASFPTPDEDEFYWVDLIGLEVSNRRGEALGSVVGLIETGPHCVLRVQPADAAAAERLIPFVAAYIDEVDLPARRIRADWDAVDG